MNSAVALLIDDYISLQVKKHIMTKEMEKYVIKVLGQDRYWKQGGYHIFAASIEDLVGRSSISPIKASGLNGLQPALYEKYRITPKNDVPDSATKQKLLTWFHPRINTAHYLTHFKDYQEDRPYLERLDSFLKACINFSTLPVITANERSFQIFCDEKWLLSRHGHDFCRRTGLTLDSLRCCVTYEPFFYYPGRMPVEGVNKINVLIVENKDTFFSLKALVRQGTDTWEKCTFSLLIYGEGRKIQKSFSFMGELEEYGQYHQDFYYFGDLDPEGILIWHDLQKQFQLPVKPFTFFYSVLFDTYGDKAPIIKDKKAGQKYSQEAINAFLSFFDERHREGMLRMLEEKKYLPQEGLHRAFLEELAEKS